MTRNPSNSKSRWKVPGVLLAGALGFAVGAPAEADWLVTKDGARVETRGPWKVDGKRILFDLPNGTLSMMRADQIDLDKSAVATAEARAAAAAAADQTTVALPKKEPVLVLTEADIPPSPVAAPEESGEKKEGAAAEGGTPLEVISWEKTELADGNGVEIFGTIRNNSANMIVTPTLLVAVYDADGGLLATNNGTVNAPQIAAGKTANFRVTFAGLMDFASAKFDAQGRGFKQRQEGEPGEGGEEPVVPPST
jgi:hypothetical protein